MPMIRINSAVSALVAAVLLSLGAWAAAEVRQGSVTDPLDQQPPSLTPSHHTDLESVVVSYDDTAGTVQAAATFFEPENEVSAHLTLKRACPSNEWTDDNAILTIDLRSDVVDE